MFFSDISTLFSKCYKNVMCLLGSAMIVSNDAVAQLQSFC